MLLFIQLSSFTQYLQGSGLDENWKCQVLQMNLTPQLQRGFPNNQFWERTACSKDEQGPHQYMKKKLNGFGKYVELTLSEKEK